MDESKPFRASHYFDNNELSQFTTKSNAKAFQALLSNYLLIALCFFIAALFPHWIVYFFCSIFLASRQLGLAVLMHECAHNSLFAHKYLNQWIGKWLCGAPILIELDGYRRYHLKHHQLAGTDKDPDYPNYKDYPVTFASMRRKLLRDILGITGVKNLVGLVMMYGEANAFDLSYKPKQQANKIAFSVMFKNILRNMAPYLIVHSILILCLVMLGVGELYWLWLITFLTTFSVLLRIRNAAEHAGVKDLLDKDPRVHTRTTLTKWWEGFLLAPYGVNYHLEHHLVPSIPAYHLKSFHQALVQRGLLDKAEIVDGYSGVLKRLISD